MNDSDESIKEIDAITKPDGAASGPDKRRAKREKIKAHARFRETGASAFEVELADLSVLGFCMTTFGRPGLGTHIWVQLPGLRSLEAVVRRVNGNEHGCEFIQPLHASVSDFLINQWGR